MGYVCRNTICQKGYPSITMQRMVHACIMCGEGIRAGELYFGTNGGAVCVPCFEGMTSAEVLEAVGSRLSVA